MTTNLIEINVKSLNRNPYRRFNRTSFERFSKHAVIQAIANSDNFSLPQCWRLGYLFAMNQIGSLMDLSNRNTSTFYLDICEVLDEIKMLKVNEFDCTNEYLVREQDEMKYLRKHTHEARELHHFSQVVPARRAKNAVERAYYKGFCQGVRLQHNEF